jgi:hypothetical protein
MGYGSTILQTFVGKNIFGKLTVINKFAAGSDFDYTYWKAL